MRTAGAGADRREAGVQSVTVGAGLQGVPLIARRGCGPGRLGGAHEDRRMEKGMIRLRKGSAHGLRASPLCHWPESFIAAGLNGRDLHLGRERDAPLFRVFHR